MLTVPFLSAKKVRRQRPELARLCGGIRGCALHITVMPWHECAARKLLGPCMRKRRKHGCAFPIEFE